MQHGPAVEEIRRLLYFLARWWCRGKGGVIEIGKLRVELVGNNDPWEGPEIDDSESGDSEVELSWT